MNRVRLTFPLVLLFAVSGLLSACGGSSGPSASTVIHNTFSNPTHIQSGQLNVSLGVKSEGTSAGNFNLSLSGPFQGQSPNIPKFNLTAKATGQSGSRSLSFAGGLTSTGNAAYISYGGSNYQVDPQTFSRFKSLLASAQSNRQQNKQSRQSASALLKQLGINPQDLVTNLKTNGSSTVDNVDTWHVSGDLNTSAVIDAISKLAQQSSSLGLGSRAPTSAQLEQIKGAIKTAHFDLYSGKSDSLLRRFDANLSVQPPAGSSGGVTKLDVTFNLTFSQVNQPQTITAPPNAKPLSALLQQFGISPNSLKNLGGLGAAAAGGAGGTGGLPGAGAGAGAAGGGGAGAGTSASKAQAYLNCISQSNGTNLQKCQALLK